jgi:DNA-directed RNA polymerase specialized sigma subunit
MLFMKQQKNLHDYRVEVKVKNNHILKRIEQAGYKTVGEFCRLNNRPNWPSRIGDYVNLKETPINSEGDFYPHVYEMANLLNCSPEDLFTETQLQTALETNKRTLEVNEAEMKFMLTHQSEPLLLEDVLHKERLSQKIDQAVNTLTPREAKVIRLRFGLNGVEPKTLEEAGWVLDVTRERIREIEAKALRKLRHPSRSHEIKNWTIEHEESQ